MTVLWWSGRLGITYKEQEDLTLRPHCCLPCSCLPYSCLPCSESLEGLQVGRSTAQEKDHSQLKELYSFDSNTGVCGGENQCGLCVCELPKQSGQRCPASSL
uniref:Ornithine decarboxylase antizyme 3 n=1 Tax=Rattus norvegicus TaxID=10116 RepID=A0A8I5ZN91_RAT